MYYATKTRVTIIDFVDFSDSPVDDRDVVLFDGGPEATGECTHAGSDIAGIQRFSQCIQVYGDNL